MGSEWLVHWGSEASNYEEATRASVYLYPAFEAWERIVGHLFPEPVHLIVTYEPRPTELISVRKQRQYIAVDAEVQLNRELEPLVESWYLLGWLIANTPVILRHAGVTAASLPGVTSSG